MDDQRGVVHLDRNYGTNGDPVFAYPEGISIMFVTEGGWPGDLTKGATVSTYVKDLGPTTEKSYIPVALQLCTPLKLAEDEPVLYSRHWEEDGNWWTEWESGWE